MPFGVQLGLLFALATAFASVVGFLYKHRGAVESPPVSVRRPVRSSLALFRSRWYTLGILIATGSWGLHVAALGLAFLAATLEGAGREAHSDYDSEILGAYVAGVACLAFAAALAGRGT